MRLRSSVFASSCLLVQALGVALFLRGFFPVPVRSVPRREARADPPAEPAPPGPGMVSNWTKIPPPLFKKIVIVLIDALRDDFVFGFKGKQFMPYTTQVVEKGTSYSFIAEAKPPTVTMPRVKALMTGSIPGFIDVVVNLNSPALLDDNLIWQAKTAGKRIIFYGDDTWVKLFPKHFVEYDGTTSFFVSDFTEVDDNVTRHLDRVLKREDWDLLILHYLGLDHIGHMTGPNSPLVGPKLREMDNILKKIHISLLSKEEASLPNLLVVCGDHGMSETGSHGGSSEGEVHTPLLFISSAFEKRSDPGYEHFKIAEKSHGNWIKLYLEGNNSEILLNLGKKVLKQYLEALKTLSSSLSKQVAQYDMYSMMVGTVIIMEVLLLLLLSVPKALSKRAEFEVPLSSPLFSLLFYLMCLMLCAVHVIVCTSAESLCYFCSMSWLTAVGVMMLISALMCGILSAVAKIFENSRLPPKNPIVSSSNWSEIDVLILAGTIGHVLSLGASSFIEEEHQTWYFLINTLCLVLCQELCRNNFLLKECEPQHSTNVRRNSDSTGETSESKNIDIPTASNSKLGKATSSSEFIKGSDKWISLATPWIILTCCRLLRSLNQTGVQWAHRPDFGHWLTSSDHKSELSFLAAVSLLMIFFLVQRRCSLVSKIAMALGLLGVYSYRAAIGNVIFPWQHGGKDISKGITEARFVYVFVLGIVFTGTKDLLKSQVISADSSMKSTGLWEVYSGLVLLAALLFRPHNLPVLVFCLLIQTMMTKYIWIPLKFDAAQITIMHYWFGQAFFYFQGNSNGIASVDISAGFVGLDSYVELPAIFLTAFATYAGPFLWAIHLLCCLSSEVSRAITITASSKLWHEKSCADLSVFSASIQRGRGSAATKSRNSAAVGHGCFCYALMRSIPIAIYVVLVTGLRYHLFIWSVFSPKLLYEGVHVFITAAVCLFFTAMDQNHSYKVQD
ncbi:GPI ethanolamine phosphate transferase 2 isoform X4 [Chamaea fasciata]|uniref:GPI ethanolamine phosphate transferase 2 isoform X4 n=1 Tax=Chamaea fasciata TaxID=190680 RepID=UPI00336A91F2